MIDYLNNSVWCTLRPSSVHGIGVFAIRDIPKGTKLTDYSVYDRETELIELAEEEFARLRPEIRLMILDRTIFMKGQPIRFYSPNSEQTLRSFMNHSDTPNSDGVFALKDIGEGEEITENYRSFYELHDLTKNHYSWL